MTSQILKFIDLFCGIGGFHQALTKIGFKCVFACDIDKNCRKTYYKNYKLKPKKDITEIDVDDIPEFDILCAGFPCFIAGTRVLTNNGYKNIEEVEISDKLLSHMGNFQNINNLQKKLYSGEIFNIRFKYHPDNIVCTPEHPFYIRERIRKWNNDKRCYDTSFSEPNWVTAKNLNMNHYVGMTINTNSIIPTFSFEQQVNQHKNETITIKLDNIDYWFMMGYFVGDGWIEETCKKDGRCANKIRFAIANNNDRDIILKRIRGF